MLTPRALPLSALLVATSLSLGSCARSSTLSTTHSTPNPGKAAIPDPPPDPEPPEPSSSPARTLPALRIVNAGSQLPSIAGGSIVDAYGSGLASVTAADFTVYPATPNSGFVSTYSATVVDARDDRVEIILPSIPVPTDGWVYLHVLAPDGNGRLVDVAGSNTYVESAAPGFITADGSGAGTPVGTIYYAPSATGLPADSHPLSDPVRANPSGTTIATFWLTGAVPLNCYDGSLNPAVVTVITNEGSQNLPIQYLGTAGPGYQQLNVDLTDWLASPYSQDLQALIHLSVLACPEQVAGGSAFWVDSNDVLLTLSSPFDTPPAAGDPWTALSAQAPLTSTQVGGQHLTSVLPYVASPDTWNQRAAAVRQAILDGAQLSPLPPKTPLNPISSRLRMREGYSVENIAFEATPGFFVSGNLFKPLHRPGPRPAILLPHGHFGDWAGYARTLAENQTLATQLARMGAVVFAYDMVGWGDAQQLDHPDDEGFLGFGDQTTFKDGTNNNLLELQLWNSIRSLDFIESLKDAYGNELVDPDRIGVTGASGGATQALYLSAVDPRIAAAALVVMITAGYTGDDWCEDGMPVHSVAGQLDTNNTEIAATIAPKPLLIVSDGADWTQDFNRDEYPYLKMVYSFFGAYERALAFDFPNEVHDYGPSKRARAYDFFTAAFGLTESAEDVVLEREPTLHVYSPAFPLPNVPMTHLLSY